MLLLLMLHKPSCRTHSDGRAHQNAPSHTTSPLTLRRSTPMHSQLHTQCLQNMYTQSCLRPAQKHAPRPT